MHNTIDIAGKKYPVSFGNAALLRFERETGVSILNMGEALTYERLLQLAHCALADGARKAKQDFALSFDDMLDLLDEDTTALGRLMNLYQESMPQVGAGDEKKGKGKR